MSTRPVSPERIALAAQYLDNADVAAEACRLADITYPVACALLEQESGGRNVYGHDKGGALSGYPYEVTQDNFGVFLWLVTTQGYKSNGVGPCQITYFPYFDKMLGENLKPWRPLDNMRFGFEILAGLREQFGSWQMAAAAYNGGPSNPDLTYGAEFADKLAMWRLRFKGL